MKNKVLVLGITGLIGSNLFRCLKSINEIDIYGTYRSHRKIFFNDRNLINNKLFKCDVSSYQDLLKIIQKIKPNFVINCIGVTKHQKNIAKKIVFEINANFPQKLAISSKEFSYKLIHISTDCIYSGKKGMYKESDPSDAIDDYGKSKAEGERLIDNSLIIRTSTIGHEYYTNYGLLNWFLSQDKSCIGFEKAIFSGVPTNIFSDIIKNIIINYHNLSGIYNIAAEPIDKYSLLKIIAQIYKKDISIISDSSFMIDRSLDGSKFNNLTKSKLPSWEILIESMYDDNQKHIKP
tara:strand:+ start:4247 stop:5122 length:876 start_codon:yes stop_codon:yes gene_type:complete